MRGRGGEPLPTLHVRSVGRRRSRRRRPKPYAPRAELLTGVVLRDAGVLDRIPVVGSAGMKVGRQDDSPSGPDAGFSDARVRAAAVGVDADDPQRVRGVVRQSDRRAHDLIPPQRPHVQSADVRGAPRRSGGVGSDVPPGGDRRPGGDAGEARRGDEREGVGPTFHHAERFGIWARPSHVDQPRRPRQASPPAESESSQNLPLTAPTPARGTPGWAWAYWPPPTAATRTAPPSVPPPWPAFSPPGSASRTGRF